MNGRARWAGCRVVRLARLLAGRNQLRRSSDRIEGAVLAAVCAALLVAMAAASVLGVHIYQSQRAGVARCIRGCPDTSVADSAPTPAPRW